MRRFGSSLAPLLVSGGAAALAYGGYGAGLGRLGGGVGHWSQVAAVAAAGCLAFGAGLFRIARGPATETPTFADDLAAVERLTATAGRHPEGLAALQDLVEIVFEVHHPAAPAAKPAAETLVERKAVARG